ncbi:tetratricopeptide repeat protein [candidate division WOR-3 bacterium]|nr:tetratricopeptide repeat protein [candidate division WOR-3 bacterium]
MKCPACGFKNSGGMNFCGKCGARLLDVQEEQRKFATVLFADLKGYTTLSESRDPEEMSDILKQLYNRFDEILNSLRTGYRDFIGDAVLALFGVPVTHGNDAENAARAALLMQRAIAQYAQEIKIPLQLRIGIHSGEVVYGEIAPVKITVTGDAINTAQRLQTVAEPGSIYVSKVTARLIEDLYTFEDLPLLTLKGKTERIKAYRLIGHKEKRAASALPLVNRQSELAKLEEVFSTVCTKQKARYVVLTGEVGMGKSKVINEFLKRIHEGSQSRYFLTRAVHIGRAPYAAIVDLLRFIFEIDPNAHDADLKKIIEHHVQHYLPSDLVAHHFIGFFFDIKYKDSPLAQLPAEQVRLSAFATLNALLQSSTAATPLLFVIEDLQYLDQGTKDVLEFVSHIQGIGSLMIVCTGWKESFIDEINVHNRKSWRSWHLIELEPLNETDSRALLNHITGGKTLPPSLITKLLHKGGGNPLFFKEFITELQDTGVLVEKEDRYQLTSDLEDIRLPANIRTLLESRVDRLSDHERDTLKHAAVIGTSFWHGILKLLSSSKIDPALKQLEEKDYIVEHKPSQLKGDREFAFQHDLLREAAYKILLKKVRRELHVKIHAALLDLHDKKRIPEMLYLQLCALHSEGAEMHQEAVDYYRQWGAHAQDRFAITDALSAFSKALDIMENILIETQSDRFGLLLKKRAEMRYFLGYLTDAAGDYTRMKSHPSRIMQVYGLLGLASIFERTGNYDKSIDHSLEAVTIAQKEGHQRLQADALNRCGLAYWRKGIFKEALKLIKNSYVLYRKTEAIAISDTERQEIKSGMGASLNSMGTVYHKIGDNEAALKAYEQSLSIFRKTNEKRKIAAVLSNIGTVYSDQGDYERALDYYNESIDHRRQIGYRYGIAVDQHNIAIIHSFLGEYDRALELYQESLSIRREIGDTAGTALTLSNIGTVYLEKGDFSTALKILEQSQEIYRETGNIHELAGVLLNMSMVHYLTGTAESAHQLQQQAEQLARSLNIKKLIASTLIVKGQLHLDADDYAKALDALDAAVDMCEGEHLASQMPLARALAVQARYHRSGGRRFKKQELAHMTDAIAQAQANHDTRAECHILLALTDMYVHEQEYKKANKVSDTLLALIKEKHILFLEPDAHFYKALAARGCRDKKTAHDHYDKALTIATMRGQKNLIKKIKTVHSRT